MLSATGSITASYNSNSWDEETVENMQYIKFSIVDFYDDRR